MTGTRGPGRACSEILSLDFGHFWPLKSVFWSEPGFWPVLTRESGHPVLSEESLWSGAPVPLFKGFHADQYRTDILIL